MSNRSSQFLIKSDENSVYVFKESEDQPTLRIPLEEVDQFCEQVYWARKAILESRNADQKLAEKGLYDEKTEEIQK